jgi:hypothetical protein
MEDNKFEFLAKKSNDLLERQINSKRSIVSTVGIIISITSVYIGIYFSLVSQKNVLVKFISFLPVILFSIAFVYFFNVLNVKKLYQGFKETELDSLLNKEIDNIYKFEIAVNQKSISKNLDKLNKIENSYKTGIYFVLFGVLLTFIILIINIVFV